jgi:hypothetical protein
MGDHLRNAQRLAWILAIVWLAWPEVSFAQSPTRGLRADRFDIALTLLPDGSVDVRETVVFHFTEKTFKQVDREIPINRFDDVIDVRASIDDRPLADNDSAERVRIRRGRNSLRVTWNFPETINASRAFTLEYRAMGSLSVANGRALMEWFVLPSRHRYLIDTARVEWRVPPTAVRVEPTRIDDPRWTSEAMADGWAATRQSIGVDESAKLIDAFDLSSMALSVPDWQTNAFRARQMTPAFAVCALTLFFSGAGIVVMTWLRYRLPSPEPSSIEPAHANELPPGMGTALVRGSIEVGLPQMQATVLDLARRGVLKIEQSSDNRKRFDVVMKSWGAGGPRDLAKTPHEEVVTGALWLHMNNSRVDLKTAWRHLSRALPAFKKSVLAELEAAGLIDSERRWAARGLCIAGIIVILLGLAGFVLFRIFFGHLGDVPLLVPGSVVISGIMFLIGGQALPVLTPAGLAAGARWRARRRSLTSTVKEPVSAADVTQWLAIAAGFGLAQKMLKASKDALGSGADGFEWLRSESPSGDALAIIIATTSAGSHGGGGSVGGGAAGGGSSGAS